MTVFFKVILNCIAVAWLYAGTVSAGDTVTTPVRQFGYSHLNGMGALTPDDQGIFAAGLYNECFMLSAATGTHMKSYQRKSHGGGGFSRWEVCPGGCGRQYRADVGCGKR